MKHVCSLLLLFVAVSCTTSRPMGSASQGLPTYTPEPSITQSLFDDASSTISEENIRRILDGSFSLPKNLRVALVKLEPGSGRSTYYWNSEEYLKSQQAYVDSLSAAFLRSDRVTRVAQLPELLVSDRPTFTSIREAAVRTQSDLVVVYTITSDLYANYKLFSKLDIKAFATTQLVVLDVRTELIPFTTIVTKEFQSKRLEAELNDSEAANRIKNQAVLVTIQEIGESIGKLLASD